MGGVKKMAREKEKRALPDSKESRRNPGARIEKHFTIPPIQRRRE